MRKFSLPKLIFCIFIPIFTGLVSSFLNKNSMEIYTLLILPNFAPPDFVFPVVWILLYLLLGIGLYLIIERRNNSKALTLFVAQLFINFLWPFIFFKYNLILIALLVHLLLLIIVIFMTINFFKVSKLAGILQFPYLIWLFFAGYLNYFIVLFNLNL